MSRNTRWAIQTIGIIAFLYIFIFAIVRNNFVYSGTSPINAIINNLRQIDAAKQQLAKENKLAPDYIPTMAELVPYLGRGKNGAGITPEGPERYVLNPIREAPYAVLESDWKPRHEGHITITNGTVFRIK